MAVPFHSNVLRFVLAFLSVILVSTAARAQGWPLPAPVPNVPVNCSGCAGVANGLATAPWSSPFRSFTGRFLDSQATKDYQQTFRTARATWVGISPERNRVYMLIGSALFAYDLDRFFTRLESREALQSAVTFPVNNTNWRTGPPERYLDFDAYFYAENGAPWSCPQVDGQDRLFGIDWDDRGLVYLAYSVFGWGIVRDAGSGSPARLMETVIQHVPNSGEVQPTAQLLISKSSTGTYTLLVSEAGGWMMNVWDVTDAASPQRKPDLRFGMGSFAKSGDGSRIAIVTDAGKLMIFTNDQLASGTALQTIDPPAGASFVSVTADDATFYASSAGSGSSRIHTVTPSGNGYAVSESQLSSVWVLGPYLRYGSGFLTLSGLVSSPGSVKTAALYRVTNAGPAEVPISSQLGRYYFVRQSAGYAVPSSSYVFPSDALVVRQSGKDHLLIMGKGLGDVWELEPPDSAPPVSSVAAHFANGAMRVSWTGNGAPSYEVWRRSSGADWARLASVSNEEYNDTQVAADDAYLYSVRGTTASGSGAFGNPALGTTFAYGADLLSGATIRATDVLELRSAIGKIRTVAGFGAYPWTDAVLQGTAVKSVHFNELRTALVTALTGIGTGRSFTTTAAPGDVIRPDFLQETRAATQW